MPDFVLNVVWDCDDIFWKNNRRAAERCGIAFERLIDFHVNENPLLSAAEKAAMNACYADPKYTQNIRWCPGIEKIPDLARYGVRNTSNSNSFSAAVRYSKLQQLRQRIPRLDEMKLQWGLVDDDSTVKKCFDDDADVLVDDSPYNVRIFPGRYVVMPIAPWNQTVKAREMLRGKVTYWFTYGHPEEAIEIVEHLATTKQVALHGGGHYSPLPDPPE